MGRIRGGEGMVGKLRGGGGTVFRIGGGAGAPHMGPDWEHIMGEGNAAGNCPRAGVW